MLKDINKLESIWASKIADYEFVGELALTKDEYEYYSSIFSDKCIILENDSHLLYRLPYKTVLVVLAVNCAYFEIRGKPYLIQRNRYDVPRIHMKIYQNRIKVRY